MNKHVKRSSTLKERLLSKIAEPICEDSCWEWIAGKDKDGYGKLSYGKKDMRAHRASYEIFKGNIPLDHFICHTCDNPSCINPNHLFSGTGKDNALDRKFKGRGNFGINHGMCKLTEKQVLDIRIRAAAPECNYNKLGKVYGVTGAHIKNILTKKLWRHV